jgi:transaldolase
MNGLQSLIDSGSKVWLDSIDPELLILSHAQGITGATSNPLIVANILKTGRYDGEIIKLIEFGLDDHSLAWELTDDLVRAAQEVLISVWRQTAGDDGYVSFELDPLIEDLELAMPHQERVEKYIELGKKWSQGHENRMIKVPATPAGIEALEELAACGLTLNVTLIFSPRQYQAAREAVWRGAQRLESREHFKSVYSIFVSRVDVYAAEHFGQLSAQAQGMVGIVNARRIWADNQAFWAGKDLKLRQEMIFASTSAKNPDDPADKYVDALAGDDIQTNPPNTIEMISGLEKTYTPKLKEPIPEDLGAEIDQKVDMALLEKDLLSDGVAKFAQPHKELLDLIKQKRDSLPSSIG